MSGNYGFRQPLGDFEVRHIEVELVEKSRSPNSTILRLVIDAGTDGTGSFLLSQRQLQLLFQDYQAALRGPENP